MTVLMDLRMFAWQTVKDCPPSAAHYRARTEQITNDSELPQTHTPTLTHTHTHAGLDGNRPGTD